VHPEAREESGLRDRVCKVLGEPLEAVEAPPVALPLHHLRGRGVFDDPYPGMTAEVHQYPLELRSAFESHHEVRLEEIDHPDMELLGGRLHHPSRRVHHQERCTLLPCPLFEPKRPDKLLDHVAARGHCPHEPEKGGPGGIEGPAVEGKADSRRGAEGGLPDVAVEETRKGRGGKLCGQPAAERGLPPVRSTNYVYCPRSPIPERAEHRLPFARDHCIRRHYTLPLGALSS